jgi:hypothetical protein
MAVRCHLATLLAALVLFAAGIALEPYAEITAGR